MLIWEAYSFFAGVICYYIPFYSYGYGVANKFGKTEDLYAASFAAIIANILMTHVQIFISIRSYTLWLTIWCLISIAETIITIGVVDSFAGEYLLHRQYREIMG